MRKLENEEVSMTCRRQKGTFCPTDIELAPHGLKHKQSDCEKCVYYAPMSKQKRLPKVLPGQEKLL